MDLSERVGFMDHHGVSMQVLSLPGLFGIDSLPASDAMPLVTVFNDEAARACSQWPGRFLALAALPLANMALACEELDRAHALGLRGAILPVDGFVSVAVARHFEPLLDRAATLGCHIFLHPGPLPGKVGNPPPYEQDGSAWLRHIVLATQSRLTEAMLTLNWSDLLAPWPKLSVQVANLGGALPFYVERLEQVCRRQLNDTTPVASRLRRCLVDTSSFGPAAIGMAVRSLGADRVVFGSDCPIFGTRETLDALDAAPISEEERALVRFGNATRALGLCERGTPSEP